jgi:hypothetical protein
MKRVQLVVTGECERVALHLSLRQIFETLEWPTPIGVASFTSTPLADPLPSGVRDTLDKFANKLIGLVDDADEDTLVIGVDDLELHGDPTLLTNAVAGAISGALEHSNWASNESRRARIRARVAALQRLDWTRVLAHSHFAKAARALIEDVADFAGEEAFPGDLHPMTARTASRSGRTLRNI